MVVIDKVVSMAEVETSWSIGDVYDAVDALNCYNEAEREAHKRAHAK